MKIYLEIHGLEDFHLQPEVLLQEKVHFIYIVESRLIIT